MPTPSHATVVHAATLDTGSTDLRAVRLTATALGRHHHLAQRLSLMGAAVVATVLLAAFVQTCQQSVLKGERIRAGFVNQTDASVPAAADGA